MSGESQPSAKTEICGDFQPQAWRKTLCVNCFHTKDEHVGDEGSSKASSGDKSTTKTDSKTSSSKSSTNTTKTPASPTPKPGVKSSPFDQTTTSKSSPVPKIKNGNTSTVKDVKDGGEKSTKVTDAKKQPASVAPKQAPDPPGKKTAPAGNKTTTAIGGGESKGAAPQSKSKQIPGRIPSSPSDAVRKQNGVDANKSSKSATSTSGVNKNENVTPGGRSSPLFASKSQKATTIDDHKTLSGKQSSIPDKTPSVKQSLSLDKSNKEKPGEVDSSSKGKAPSKVLGLLKSFKTDETNTSSSDVTTGKERNTVSDKNETKSLADASKQHANKDSPIAGKSFSPTDHKKTSSSSSSSSDTSRPSSISTPPLPRAHLPADSAKVKFGDVTSRSKTSDQGVNQIESPTPKDKNGTDSGRTKPSSGISVGGSGSIISSSKGKTFGPTLSKSEKEPVGINVNTQLSAAESAKTAELARAKSEEQLKCKELELDKINRRLKEMEEKCKKLSEENAALKKTATDSKKEEVERNLSSCRKQLATMEAKCSKLQGDNTELQNKMKACEAQVLQEKLATSSTSNKGVSQIERDLEICDTECQELKAENLELRKELSNLKIEMEEMYDTFKENEMDEFRELQKELDITSKNCRILQFKLRKSERRYEQTEADRRSYEDKLRSLQSQFTADDARDHIRSLEEDLKMAKEVSVRLHDEIDLLEDKKAKVDDENRQLTEILEQADKKQFRMEMDIDRLKDQIADLKEKVPRSQTEQDTRDRRTLLGRIGKQSSGDQEMSQMTRDLYDSVERENDLTEQLKFTEEETKMMRKKMNELEEENERLNIQLKKLSKDSMKSLKKDAGVKKEFTTRKDASDKIRIVVTDADDSDSSMTDTDTDTDDEMNLIEAKLQLNMMEQELSLSHRKITDVEQQNENLNTQIQVLKEQLAHREQLLSVVPSPPSPVSYYEDKMKELTAEIDDLRWKVIEKDRTIERLSTRASAKAREGKLKKARSLDSEPHVAQISDLRKQLDIVSHEAELFKDRLANSSAEAEQLAEENARLRLLQRVPSVQADDAAIENIELRDKGRKLEEENKNLVEKVKLLTDSLQTLTKTPRSPTSDQSPSLTSTSSTVDGTNGSRDLHKQLEQAQEENKTLRKKMADLETELDKQKLGDTDSSGKLKNDSKPKETPEAKVPPSKKSEVDSRDHLMESILDLEDELDEIKSKLRIKEAENIKLDERVKSLLVEIEEIKEDGQQTEKELLEELEMVHDKNSVLSNLLDIVNERAETAEKELEQQYQQQSSPSERSASAVSALSGASVGSDDVFLIPPSLGALSPTTDKSLTVNTDWDNQMKKRVTSLERLLAEERQKVQTVEKKLRLADPSIHTSGMSDDTKLHLREKELLQDELIEHQKHMKIANDQIKGLKERLSIMEEENMRLKMDYGKICDELEQRISDHEKTPENELEPPLMAANTLTASPTPRPRSPLADTADIGRLKEQCAKFKLKAEELEYKVEELNEIWKSKGGEAEREKQSLEEELRVQATQLAELKQTIQNLNVQLGEQEKKIKEQAADINNKNMALNRREDFLQEQDDVIRERDDDFQMLLNQVSQREETIRNLRDDLSNRDERLKEKDDYIERLNKTLDERQEEETRLNEEVKTAAATLKEKEVVIAILHHQISESCVRDTGSETDIEKENVRLKQIVRSSQTELEKTKAEKENLLAELEKSRKALDEAMLMWERNRSGLQTDMNILMEKLRLYEINTTMDQKDMALNLKSDAERYFKEKEQLSRELHLVKQQQGVDTRGLKEQVAALQSELVEKNRLLKEEVEMGTRLHQEVDRLASQAELAYKLQQEEKILRAEYLAMKVRYETRIDKMTRDYSRVVIRAEKLEKEGELDKEIIQGIQKGMLQLKEAYTQDLIHWEDEKHRLEKHSKEIEDSRELALEMKKKIVEFKEKVVEQDYLRTELVNKCATIKASGEIEKANLQSRINQLEEALTLTNKAQSKAKDQQHKMETVWQKERAEQNRLLQEAHKLALDLQQQIKDRDAEFTTYRRELLKQLDSEKQRNEQERRQKQKALTDLEVLGKKCVILQEKFKQVQEKMEKEHGVWSQEKTDLRKQLVESEQARTKHMKRLDDILGNLIKLREIGAVLAAEEELDTRSSSGIKSSPRQQSILKYIKNSVCEITSAAEQLAKENDSGIIPETSTTQEEKSQFRRSLSSSEIPQMKEQISTTDYSPVPYQDTLTVYTSIHRSATYDKSTELPSSKLPELSPYSRLSDHIIPSYNSGTRSAQSSRAHTPDSLDRGRLQPSPVSSTEHQQSPTTSIPSSYTASRTTHQQSFPRPRTLTKSVSMDTPATLPLPGVSNKSASTTNTPTIPISGSFTSGYGDLDLSPPASNFNRLTPKSARKKFFEHQSPVSPGFGFLSWPDRKAGPSHHQQQQWSPSLPRQEASTLPRQTSEIGQPASRPVSQMRLSASMDEKMHHQVAAEATASGVGSTEADTLKPKPEVPIRAASPAPKTAKEKRKFFKKSSSLDSTVGSSIAKIGMQAIPPAAPSGFTPTDFFSTIKGKFKGKKGKGKVDPFLAEEISSGSVSTDDLDKCLQRESSPTPAQSSTSARSGDPLGRLVPVGAKPDNTETRQTRSSRSATGTSETDSRRWRSKSAERPHRVAKPVMVHSDVITPIQVWKFSETAV